MLDNTISRRDYMFSAQRTIAKVDIHDRKAYIEVSQYPMLRYFYAYFMQAMQRGSLCLNFMGYVSENGTLVHMLECIPQCFNFHKGISMES